MMLVSAIEHVFDKSEKATPEAIPDEIEKTQKCVGINAIFHLSPKDRLGLESSAFIVAVVRGGDWWYKAN